VLAADEALEIRVVASRLDRARSSLSPKTGTSIYRFAKEDINALPEGEGTPLNQVMLQAPGVVQGDFGELHVRGEMVQPQYRLNGIVIPEGIRGFGQVFDTRLADRIEFLTGALPAQYGYRTAGVVEIHTKEGLAPSQRGGLLAGSYKTLNPSVEFTGTRDAMNYYVTGSWMQNDLGILSPTPGRESIHNKTEQARGFGYFSYLTDPTTRWSLILGSAAGRFQIPNNPGQTPSFPLDGVALFPNLPSSNLDDHQRETSRYAVVALQSAVGPRFDYQLSLYSRYSSVLFEPDLVGDLIYNGVASRVSRTNLSYGLQGDGAYRASRAHTVRIGISVGRERTESDNTSTVFPADATGNQLPGTAFTVIDNNSIAGWLVGLYVQHEWQISDRLTLNYGLRLDLVRGFVQAEQLSPRIGFVYKPNAKLALHAGYSRYFTPPRFEAVSSTTLEKFQNTTNAPANNLNSRVRPERMHYFDFGAAYQVSPHLNLGVNAYYKYARDLGDFGQFGRALVFSPFNYDRARIYGLELTASYKKDDLTGYLNFARSTALAKGIVSGQFNFDPDELAFIEGRYVHLDHDQRYTASGGLSYLWSGTRLSVNFIYGSGMRRGFANTESLPSYTQANLGAARSLAVPGLDKLDLRMSVVNLFDRVYLIRDGTGIGVGAPQHGPRRGIFLTMGKAF
jgi:outer membrane receptor protein involved in Fe transport